MLAALLPAVVERLRTQAPRFTGRVYLAADLDRLIEEERKVDQPEAFVLLTAERAEIATVVQQFDVFVALAAAADPLGEDALGAQEWIAEDVLHALEGWSATTEHRPTAYAGASLTHFTRARLLWQLTFTAVRERAAIMQYELGFLLGLDVGASVPTVLGLLAGVVTSVIPDAIRFESDYLEQLERALDFGETGFQLAALSGSKLIVNSNITRDAMRVVVRVFHRLEVDEEERDYTENEMQTELAALLDPDVWRVAGVHSVIEGPELNFPADVERL